MGLELSEHGDQIDHARGQWRRERPELDTSPMEVFARLSRVQYLAERVITETLAEHGLTLAGFDVLASLRRSGPPYRCTPSELARISLLSTGGVTFRLDRLESAGLIERERDDRDRRVIYSKLTPKGLKVIDAALSAHFENEDRRLAPLSRSERGYLGEMLRRLEVVFATSEKTSTATPVVS